MRTARTVPIALLALAFATPAQAWQQHAGPVLTASQGWEKNSLFEPTVIYDDGLFKMWYSAGWENCSLGYAESHDGINWTKYPGNPVLQGACRNSITRVDGHYVLIYSSGIGASADSLYTATSPDGVQWTVDPVPILTPGGWNTALANSYAWHDTGGWHLLYDARAFPVWKTGYAEGPDLHHLTTGGPLAIDLPLNGGPWLDGDTLYLIGNRQAKDLPSDIYTVRWPELSPAQLVLGRDQSWEVDQVADPSVAVQRIEHTTTATVTTTTTKKVIERDEGWPDGPWPQRDVHRTTEREVTTTQTETNTTTTVETHRFLYFSGCDNPVAFCAIGVATA